MLRAILTVAPPVALLLVGVLLVEPPYLTPADRIPTLRLLTGETESIGTPEEQLREVLLRLLGPSNRGGERVGAVDLHSDVVVVQWQLNRPDRPSLRRIDAQRDVRSLLRWALLVSTPSLDWNPRQFTFVGSRPVSFETATQAERRVLELTYSAEQVTGIDWDTFRPQDVYGAAHTAQIDPLLR